jgi:hypothetical protein
VYGPIFVSRLVRWTRFLGGQFSHIWCRSEHISLYYKLLQWQCPWSIGYCKYDCRRNFGISSLFFIKYIFGFNISQLFGFIHVLYYQSRFLISLFKFILLFRVVGDWFWHFICNTFFYYQVKFVFKKIKEFVDIYICIRVNNLDLFRFWCCPNLAFLHKSTFLYLCFLIWDVTKILNKKDSLMIKYSLWKIPVHVVWLGGCVIIRSKALPFLVGFYINSQRPVSSYVLMKLVGTGHKPPDKSPPRTKALWQKAPPLP